MEALRILILWSCPTLTDSFFFFELDSKIRSVLIRSPSYIS